MHERSLVNALIEKVFDEARIRGLHRIYEIQVQIGEFSGVEPCLFESAFDEMALATFGSGVRLRLEVVRLEARCQTCATEFLIEDFRFICPKCNADDVKVIRGEELQLVNFLADRRPERAQNEY